MIRKQRVCLYKKKVRRVPLSSHINLDTTHLSLLKRKKRRSIGNSILDTQVDINDEFTLGATVSFKGPYWTCPGSSTVSTPRIVRASDKMSSACSSIITAAVPPCTAPVARTGLLSISAIHIYSAQVTANPRSRALTLPKGSQACITHTHGSKPAEFPDVSTRPTLRTVLPPMSRDGYEIWTRVDPVKPLHSTFDTASSFQSCSLMVLRYRRICISALTLLGHSER